MLNRKAHIKISFSMEGNMPHSDLQLDFCQNPLTDEFQGDGGENEPRLKMERAQS